MDNLTHTLAGLALAESGLKRTTRLASLTLVLGANLPDVDVFAYFSGGNALAFRRGWTHGVLAMVVLPLLLTALLLGVHRLLRRNPEAVRPGWLLLLAGIGVWSHPLLDLLNTYGVRLLMPFSPRWFYGDALFIVDPWVWLTLLLGIVLARRQQRPERQGAAGHWPARAALLLFAGYALGMGVLSRLGVRAVERRAPEPATRVLASPVFARPLARALVRELPGRYELGRLQLGTAWRYHPGGSIPDGADQPAARAAAATATGATFLRWARFPRFAVHPDGDGGVLVRISDVRYGGAEGQGWASVTIRLGSTGGG